MKDLNLGYTQENVLQENYNKPPRKKGIISWKKKQKKC
jgi:hypothetical protein